jgi:metal-responsive CopG/Arc/MetJ family transcriptional regulator
MERIEAMVPPPLYEDVEDYKEERGFNNRSQAIRWLLREGLDGESNA